MVTLPTAAAPAQGGSDPGVQGMGWIEHDGLTGGKGFGRQVNAKVCLATNAPIKPKE